MTISTVTFMKCHNGFTNGKNNEYKVKRYKQHEVNSNNEGKIEVYS